MDNFLLENGQPDLKKINKLLSIIKIPYTNDKNEIMAPLKYSLFREYVLTKAGTDSTMKDFVKEKYPNLPKKYIKLIANEMRV
jgi:hypothetical protein